VWLWMGDPDRADPALIPDFWPCSHADWNFDGDYYHLKCDYRLVIDNLMDLTHETYTHQGSIGQQEILDVPIETRVEGNSVIVSRWMSGIEAPHSGATRSSRRVWSIAGRCAIFCRLIGHHRCRRRTGQCRFDARQTRPGCARVRDRCADPESDISCHYFWGMTRNFDTQDVGFTARLKKQQAAVFLEDVAVLEAQQASVLANPQSKMRASASIRAACGRVTSSSG